MGGGTEKEILAIIETALKREVAAQDLYAEGAKKAERPEVKSMFEQLRSEEEKHETLLKDIYRQVKKRLGLKILSEDE
jgi:rubrerythrin